MIAPEKFLDALMRNGIDFFAGVPDSLLKDFLAVVNNNVAAGQHQVCANEGSAVALAAGYHMGSGHLPAVYMQNSGLGNAVNPLLSLCHETVYSIPMLLIIGWRGQPGVHDEPQHIATGASMLAMLDTMQIPYEVITGETTEVRALIASTAAKMREQSTPIAFVLERNCFQSRKTDVPFSGSLLSREAAIKFIVDCLFGDEIVVGTTGYTSRELFDLREASGHRHTHDFLNVGAMGHASSIALGLALAQPNRQVICLDGDGAALMHLGALPAIAGSDAANFKHIVLNNRVHDSVGGQPTASRRADLSAIAAAAGYRFFLRAGRPEELEQAIELLLRSDGPAFLELTVNPGAREDLGRPPSDFKQAKLELMKFLGSRND
jgi:phosphonopyruvate decarboxylase